MPGSSWELRTLGETPVSRRRRRVERPVEPDEQLLPGEVLTSSDPDDAAHWVAVYSELVDVLEEYPDHVDLQQTIGRYRARLAYWRGQLTQAPDGLRDSFEGGPPG